MSNPVRTCVASFGLLSISASAIAQSTFEPLPFLPGSSDSRAYAVSSEGLVAVGYCHVGDNHRAVRWTLGGAEDLGTLPGATASDARGVSGDGQRVVGWGDFNSTDHVAFCWTPSEGLTPLGGQATPVTYAVAISADGSCVVGTWYLGEARAFRWTEKSGLTNLVGGEALAVSGDGATVVGTYASLHNPPGAWRWEDGRGILHLPALPGGSFAHAAGISRDGSTTVGTSDAADRRLQAVRWIDASAVRPLGSLGCEVFSRAIGASHDGAVIVGDCLIEGTGYRAWVWTAKAGMLDLASYCSLPAQWSQFEVLGVAASGRSIVGYARNAEGNNQGWIAHIENVESPYCGADWNYDWGLNSQDFFNFISDFFGGHADFNHCGGTNSQDFFDFITAFFNGCK